MKLRDMISSDRRSPGFTLIELMIALTIIAVLASIAVPMYSKQVQKSRRVDARTAVTDLAGREERYLSTAGTYTNVAANLGYTALPVVVGSGGYYTLSVNVPVVAAGVQPTYTAIATVVATSSQVKDLQCQYFSVDNTGKQFSSATNAGGADTSTTCWN
jgi:type IV pilus assembly protein PilE